MQDFKNDFLLCGLSQELLEDGLITIKGEPEKVKKCQEMRSQPAEGSRAPQVVVKSNPRMMCAPGLQAARPARSGNSRDVSRAAITKMPAAMYCLFKNRIPSYPGSDACPHLVSLDHRLMSPCCPLHALAQLTTLVLPHRNVQPYSGDLNTGSVSSEARGQGISC